MSQQYALQNHEQFSDEEAVTVVRAERPTLRVPVPRALLEFGDAHSGEMSVAPSEQPGACTSEMRLAKQELAEALFGDRLAPRHDVSPTVDEFMADREEDFWASEPRYSSTTVRPIASLSLPPVAPTPRRRALSKFLFGALFSGIVTLLAYEALILAGFRW